MIRGLSLFVGVAIKGFIIIVEVVIKGLILSFIRGRREW